MKSIIVQSPRDEWYLVSMSKTDTVKLNAIALNPAFREAEKIDPDLSRETWVDKNNLNQPYHFDTSRRPIGYGVRARDEQTDIVYWWTGRGWSEMRKSSKKYVRPTSSRTALQSARDYCIRKGLSQMIDFEYTAVYD